MISLFKEFFGDHKFKYVYSEYLGLRGHIENLKCQNHVFCWKRKRFNGWPEHKLIVTKVNEFVY